MVSELRGPLVWWVCSYGGCVLATPSPSPSPVVGCLESCPGSVGGPVASVSWQPPGRLGKGSEGKIVSFCQFITILLTNQIS